MLTSPQPSRLQQVGRQPVTGNDPQEEQVHGLLLVHQAHGVLAELAHRAGATQLRQLAVQPIGVAHRLLRMVQAGEPQTLQVLAGVPPPHQRKMRAGQAHHNRRMAGMYRMSCCPRLLSLLCVFL